MQSFERSIAGGLPVRARTFAASSSAVDFQALEGRWLLSSTYYVDASLDAPAGAYPSLEALQSSVPVFAPGDEILLRSAQNFMGSLKLGAEDAGGYEQGFEAVFVGTFDVRDSVVVADEPTAPAPLVGRATISVPATADPSATNHAIHVQDTGNVVIRNLELSGSALTRVYGHTESGGSGLFFSNLSSDPAEVRQSFVRVDHVDVHHFPNRGILFDDLPDRTEAKGDGKKTGFNDVRITNVKAHDNVIAGIEVLGDFDTAAGMESMYAHSKFYVGHTEAYNNTGRASYTAKHTGSGIVVSDVEGAVIEHSRAHHNGANNDATGGPVGIWAWDARGVIIQHNESYENRTDAGADGGGFDLDGGVTDSVMQYNYSHDNYGAGYGVFQFQGARRYDNNTVRYNLSVNDGRKGGYGGIHIWNGNGSNGITNLNIYNNTIHMDAAGLLSGAMPRGIYVQSPNLGARVANNVFRTSSTSYKVVDVSGKQPTLVFRGNDYWTTGGSSPQVAIKWFAKTYKTVAEWAKGTGQEKVGTQVVGLQLDPGFAAGAGAERFKLSGTSALIDRARNLASDFGLSGWPGPTDFFGGSLAGVNQFDVGAHELEAVLT
jgi:hypothetical protein